MTRPRQTIVIGGGVIGCSIAYELAKAGCAVTLLERATPGAEASGAAAGMLTTGGEPAETLFQQLAIASWRLYPAVAHELRERTGIDVEHVTRGTIYPLFGAQEIRQAEAHAASALAELGVEVWDRAEAHAREPALSSKVSGALFVGGDHWVNNQRLVVAYAQAAVSAGVALQTGCSVSRLIVEGDRVRGVVAEGERLEADTVVLAAGAWTAALTESLGSPLPVEPRRGQMVALTHVPPVLRHCVHGNEIYLVPRPSGELLIGATVERVGFLRAVTAEGVASLLQTAIELVPELAGLPISRTWYGFRPWAPDSMPILGPWPGIDGLWVATAHFRNGILLAPITAQVMRDWIVAGRPPLPLDDFLPDRFLKRGRER
ncbi:MAG TPA: glycine oxidase ThiO [Methylomirabilota bacterium]